MRSSNSHGSLRFSLGRLRPVKLRSMLLLGAAALVALAVLPAEAAEVPAATSPRPRTAPKTDPLQEHVAKLRETAPKGFSIVVSAPFVVLGDGEPDFVKKNANGVVAWAVDKLKQDYFQTDPKEIIDVWLFKDDTSYRHHAKLLFNDEPDTPYGYYSETHRALVMNISTGGGTLVHEIVHPFIHANFPDCPSWFNEGLASLYEQSAEKDGHIWGLINWRYAGLEKAIQDGKLLSFQQLTGLNTREFYGGDAYNAHYAQARYLCFYLQEKGLLRKYYREFVANVKTDPTGYTTLQRVLDEKDMAAFQKKWEKYILDLHPR